MPPRDDGRLLLGRHPAEAVDPGSGTSRPPRRHGAAVPAGARRGGSRARPRGARQRRRRRVVAEVRRALEDDGAEAVILGWAGMADPARRITAEVGANVIDGVAAATKMAEALAGLGLMTSKVGAYAAPQLKPYTGAFAAVAPGALLASAAE